MKKALLTLAVVALGLTANAQFVVGGSLGFTRNAQTYSFDGDKFADNTNTQPTAISFELSPKVGYQLNEKIQLGLMLNYSHEQSISKVGFATDMTELGTKTKNIINMFGVGVYGRYNVASVDRLTFFAEAQLALAFGSGKVKTINDKNPGPDTDVDGPSFFGLGIGIVPGVNYAFNERFSMDLYVDMLGLGYNMVKTTSKDQLGQDKNGNWKTADEVVTEHDFGFNCGGDFSLTLGINYRF